MMENRNRGGRGKHWTMESVDLMLDIVEEILPKGQNDWERVCQQYNVRRRFGMSPRDEDAIKSKFKKIKNLRKPTGVADCPAHVRRAKSIQRRIEESMATITMLDDFSVEDDVLVEQTLDEETNTDKEEQEEADEFHSVLSDGAGDTQIIADTYAESQIVAPVEALMSAARNNASSTRSNASRTTRSLYAGNDTASSDLQNSYMLRSQSTSHRRASVLPATSRTSVESINTLRMTENSSPSTSFRREVSGANAEPMTALSMTATSSRSQSPRQASYSSRATTTPRTGLPSDLLSNSASNMNACSPNTFLNPVTRKKMRLDMEIQKQDNLMSRDNTMFEMYFLMQERRHEELLEREERRLQEQREREESRAKEEREREERREKEQRDREERQQQREEIRQKEEREREDRREHRDRQFQLLLFSMLSPRQELDFHANE